MKTVFFFAALILAASSIALSQDLRTATLVGTVTDPSGATVAGAAVTVTNVDTQVITKGKTNEDGAYYAPFLIIGNYRLVALRRCEAFRRRSERGRSGRRS
jgi:hypothetical protein